MNTAGVAASICFWSSLPSRGNLYTVLDPAVTAAPDCLTS
jgi:hypothetical protein